MMLASKNFSIERLSDQEHDLRVRYKCLTCGVTSICDLYKVSLEKCLNDHLQKCAKAGSHGATSSSGVSDSAGD